jgi:glycosyltransferase involved in cell wall biosynthesis
VTDNIHVALIIPARNEVACLREVLDRVPSEITTVVVVDNGSTDGTADLARAWGAQVVREEYPGYGSACLAGLAFLAKNPPDIVAFADADGSDGVQNLSALLQPVIAGTVDIALVLRVPVTSRAFTFQQRFGNRLAVCLIRFFWRYNYHDLGPMRALTWQALEQLQMEDKNFGWTVEMQIKALKAHLRIVEIPLPYYARIAGRSKISRTLTGVMRAGAKILGVIALELWRGRITKQRKLAVSVPAAIPTREVR